MFINITSSLCVGSDESYKISGKNLWTHDNDDNYCDSGEPLSDLTKVNESLVYSAATNFGVASVFRPPSPDA